VSNDVQIGRMVQSIRVSRNLAQAQLAARAGVGRGTVSALERGLVEGMTVGPKQPNPGDPARPDPESDRSRA